MDRTCAKILAELGWPPIYFISQEQFLHVEGVSVKGSYGISSTKYPVFTIQKGLRGKVKTNTIFHECAHILFPHWPHWKVEAFAEKMAGGGGKGYFCQKYGHSVDDLPPRSYLLKLARRASKRLKH